VEARYRKDYPGEFVVVESRRINGRKEETREWIANPIENQHISGRAACIGSSFDKEKFDYTRLQRHRGGLLGSKKLQTYGTGDAAFEMRLDFTVESNLGPLEKLLEAKYQEQNVIYTTAKNCLIHPGEFYLIPQHPHLLDIALLPYLAAFDGHQEIFLLGYNKETPVQNPHWVDHVNAVIAAYTGTLFYLVGNDQMMPDVWLNQSNTKCITQRDFITYCDV
jgi:hypothetical protein